MGPDRSADSGKTSYYDKKIHCPLLPIAVGELIRLCGAADDCGFNRSMQHLISNYREEDVDDEQIPRVKGLIELPNQYFISSE